MEEDVTEALATLGSEPVTVEPIGRNWRDGRATYRVTLRDGRVVKARRVQGREDKVISSTSLLVALEDGGLPAPISTFGHVTLESWVEGHPVAGQRLTTATVEAAADLLGRLHRVAVVDGRPVPRMAPTADELEGTRTGLAELAAAGVVERGDARRLATFTVQALPDRAEWGVIHGDLCADNLVVRSDGELVSVDNESLRMGFPDYDLGRTWSRWPMPLWAWRRFTLRYETWGRSFPPTATDNAWRVVAAVKSAALWNAGPTGVGDEGRQGLRRVIEALSS